MVSYMSWTVILLNIFMGVHILTIESGLFLKSSWNLAEMTNKPYVIERSVSKTVCLMSCIKAYHDTCVGIQHSTTNCGIFHGEVPGGLQKDETGDVYYIKKEVKEQLDTSSVAITTTNAVTASGTATSEVTYSILGTGGPCGQVLTGFREYVDVFSSLINGTDYHTTSSASLCKDKCLEDQIQCDYFTYHKTAPLDFNNCGIHKYPPLPENGGRGYADPNYDTYARC
ncbi:Uncharacterised protein g9364 [Pycnogonum litorale]